MKVIITGATGFIGSAALTECIHNPSISSILVLSRRPLPEAIASNPKLTVVIHEDFSSYPSDILAKLEGAEGCIWCLGGKLPDFPSLDVAKKVCIDYTLAAANAFAETLAPRLKAQGKFRFVFCSGRGAEPDAGKGLWVFSDTRKVKGAVEKGLLDIAEKHPASFETTILRPGGVIPEGQAVLGAVAGFVTPVVSVTDLAKALVVACINPLEKHVVENEELVELAKGGAGHDGG